MRSLEINPTRPGRVGVVQHLLLGLGCVAFAAGAIGLVVPLFPTTVFWILAAWCFGRSRPDMRDRLYAHAGVGRVLADFMERGIVSRPVKRMAIAGIAVGFGATVLLSGMGWRFALGLGMLLGGVPLYVASRPERHRLVLALRPE